MLQSIKEFIRAWRDYPVQPGQRIGERYEVAELLGMGSYGLSYRCIDRQDGQEVALKQAKPSRRRLAGLLLRRERDALLAMEHPSIPRCKDFFTYRKRDWLAADYIRGRTLEDLIFEEKRVFDEADCLRWALELLDLIGYVHARGYVHLDIRIPNVMMDEKGIHLIDFGLARRIGEDEVKAPDGSLIEGRMPARIYSDLEDAGHLLLYMLYSGYAPPGEGISPASKLLQHSPSSHSVSYPRGRGAAFAAGKSMPVPLPESGEPSWEDELDLSARTKGLLRRLLRLDTPFADTDEAQKAISESLDVLRND
ncbi:serine/threonine protein kinase [Saccharibacillus sacchari]|uniref:serine/threonine protein kinase n=1 Tax=Saccharibacillus sacchari TaxID=456493 RepID=UPI0004BC567C|nr:protein kinase [Saccharibacillus sacchari]